MVETAVCLGNPSMVGMAELVTLAAAAVSRELLWAVLSALMGSAAAQQLSRGHHFPRTQQRGAMALMVLKEETEG
jgi:hypothetical protein